MLVVEDLRTALRLQGNSPNKKLGEILQEMDVIKKDELDRAILETLNLPRVTLEGFDFNTKITSLIPVELVRSLHVMPLMFHHNVLILATFALPNIQSLELLRFTVEHPIQFVLTSPEDLALAIKNNYQEFQAVQELDIPTPELIDEQRIWRDA